MENRRQSYRHPFRESEPVEVEIAASEEQLFRGELLDLSVGGAKLRVDATCPVSVGGRLTIGLLRRQTPPLRLELGLAGEVKHVEREGRYVFLCVQFVPQKATPAGDPRERTLSRFLAEEQRRVLRARIPGLEN